jgi:hypothetical protein
MFFGHDWTTTHEMESPNMKQANKTNLGLVLRPPFATSSAKVESPKMEATKPDDVPTTWLHLKAPVEFFERIDAWIVQEQARRKMTLRPSRPAAIRWIVHQFLLKQEQQKQKRKTMKGRRRGSSTA